MLAQLQNALASGVSTMTAFCSQLAFHKVTIKASAPRSESKHRVNVVFAGHDHHYHRAVINGTHHITTAGGGAGLYDPDTPAPETVIAKKVNHLCRVDVGQQEVKVRAIEISCDIIEQVELPRRD